nr:head GIN domain-containing protein [uncultured Flavobacterium sp.]
MKKILFSLLLISSLTYSQNEKKVGDFHKVTAFDQITVTLIASDENKVALSGINSNEVEVVNRNGELKLRMPLTKLLKGNQVKVKVYYTDLDVVEANEGAQISSEAIFKGTAFDIIAKEGAKINVRLEVSKLNIKITSGGIVNTEGTAKNQDVLVSTGGIYEGKELITEQTIISSNAGGEAAVFATELVDAKVRVGGDITVYGKPKQVNQKTIAGGHIEIVK